MEKGYQQMVLEQLENHKQKKKKKKREREEKNH